MATGVKLLTAAEVRAEIQRLPEQFRDIALQLLASSWDDGFGVGAGHLPRRNPFVPVVTAAATKSKGKLR